MADYRLTDDKPYNMMGRSARVVTGAAPVSIQVPVGGIYAMSVVGMTDAHLLAFRIASTALEAETIVAMSATFQQGVSVRTYLDVRPVYIGKDQFVGVRENATVAGLVVTLTLLHQFGAEGFVG